MPYLIISSVKHGPSNISEMGHHWFRHSPARSQDMTCTTRGNSLWNEQWDQLILLKLCSKFTISILTMLYYKLPNYLHIIFPSVLTPGQRWDSYLRALVGKKSAILLISYWDDIQLWYLRMISSTKNLVINHQRLRIPFWNPIHIHRYIYCVCVCFVHSKLSTECYIESS